MRMLGWDDRAGRNSAISGARLQQDIRASGSQRAAELHAPYKKEKCEPRAN